MDREVTLPEVLDAREQRAYRQQFLLDKHGRPVVSFTLNIPGPVKDTSLIRRAFDWGKKELFTALENAGFGVNEALETRAVTGCEVQLSVQGEAAAVKALCVRIEESCPLGRLFDMDVIAPDGQKLDRETERCCLVCGARGRGCASRRVHTVPELQAATRKILVDHFAALDARRIEELATRALRDEVDATPKPGLVDRRNTGSHRDMTRETFAASARALSPYWGECFTLGLQSKDKTPEETFLLLRAAGLRAEEAMLTATGGVNTHKGVIFTLGTVCGAVGLLWTPEEPCRDPERIARECRDMFSPVLARDLAAADGRTAGERLYLRTGQTGARGELAAGLPGVIQTALPALERALDAGADYNLACVAALLALIGRGTDTNMIHRGGPEAAHAASQNAAALVKDGRLPTREELEALDVRFIRENLSPGGCADLLAVAVFLRHWKSAQF